METHPPHIHIPKYMPVPISRQWAITEDPEQRRRSLWQNALTLTRALSDQEPTNILLKEQLHRFEKLHPLKTVSSTPTNL